MNKISSLLISLILLFIPYSTANASERINGSEIKKQAVEFFANKSLSLSLLVSDKRTFFPCSEPLLFNPRQKDDWSTVTVECESQGWKTMVRSQNSLTTNAINNFESDPLGTHVLVLAKNISKGEVISQNHLKIESRPERQLRGAYKDPKDILGRKAKNNLAAGTIIKPRHVDIIFTVNKEDTVLVIASNAAITITTAATALESGQIGDMIPVRNINSQKILKVIITGEKKVAPITNM